MQTIKGNDNFNHPASLDCFLALVIKIMIHRGRELFLSSITITTEEYLFFSQYKPVQKILNVDISEEIRFFIFYLSN